MKRLTYIDGLKGYCALSVCILHFLLMFKIDGYVGWNCMEDALTNKTNYYFSHFPYSLLTNNSLPLYIFFALISFIICYQFLGNKNEDKLKSKIITRYFRFMPIVFISCLITFILIKLNLCKVDEYYSITNNTWGYAVVNKEYNIFDFFKYTLFKGYFEGLQLLSPLWCLNYLFLGSMLAYFIMLIYDKINNKYLLFIFLILMFFFFDQTYLSFIIGIIAAIIVKKEINMKKLYSILLIILGLIIGFFPLVLLPSIINISTLYAISAGLIIIGTHYSFKNNYLLNNKFIQFIGKESLSAILVQMIILQSLNIYLFILFNNIGLDININILINFIINIILIIIFTWVYSKTITPITNFVCNKVNKIIKQ